MRKALLRLLAWCGVLACTVMSQVEAQEKEVIFYAPFDGTAKAAFAQGKAEPEKAERIKFVPGLRGQAVIVEEDGTLIYSTANNLTKDRGSVEIWVSPLWNATDTEDKQVTRYLFRDSGPESEPSDTVRLKFIWWPGKITDLSYDLRERLWQPTPCNGWQKGQWHQVVATWDCQVGMRLYIDGNLRRFRWNEATTDFTFEPKTYPQMYIGCHGNRYQAKAAVDEVRIYDRMLSRQEVAERYRKTMPLDYFVFPRVLWPGEKTRVNIRVMNRATHQTSGDLRWSLLDTDGNLISSGEDKTLSLGAGKEANIAANVQVDHPGSYRLALHWSGGGGFEQQVPVMAPARRRAAKVEDRPELELALVDSVDCANPGPNRFWHRGPVKIIDSEVGRYCEASTERWSRLTYKLVVQEVQQPHLLSIRYPDDRDRTVCIGTGTVRKDNPWDLEVGYSTGGEYPCTGQMLEAHYIWWPRAKETALSFATWTEGKPAAVSSIIVSRIQGGLSGIPQLKVIAPQGEEGRRLAMEWEDASLYNDLGHRGLKPTIENYDLLINRLTAYMGYLGMDTFLYPALFYAGPFYHHSQSLQGGADEGRMAGHPDNWLELSLRKFTESGLRYYPTFNLRSTQYLDERNNTDMKRVKAGDDTLSLVSRENSLTGYNPIHPVVRKHYLDLVTEVVERCEDSPSWGGISLYLWSTWYFWFQGIENGYGDYTVGLFEKETGIKVPVAKTDPQRFYKRYRFLVGQHKDKWIDWRCQKIAEVMADMAKVVTRKRKDARLLLSCFMIPRDYYDLWARMERGDTDPAREWRLAGIDLEKLAAIPGIVVQRVAKTGCYRCKQGHAGKQAGLEINLWRDVLSLPQFAAPYNHAQAILRFHEDYYEQYMNKHPIEGSWWTDSLWAGTSPGAGRYYLEPMAWAMALMDPLMISRGGTTIDGQGDIQEYQEFARAFRALPAKQFTTWTATPTQPAFVREYDGKAGHYLYAVNADNYPVEVTIRLARKQGKVKELSFGRTVGLKRGAIVFQLKPFELQSFLAPKGSKITTVELKLPPEQVEKLATGLAEMKDALRAIEGKADPEDIEYYRGFVVRIEKAMQEHRYFEVRRFTESYYGARLRAMVGSRPWVVIGPFDNEESKAFDTIYPPEKKIDLEAQYEGVNGQKVAWKKILDEGLLVDFDNMFQPNDWVLAYAVTKVYSPEDRDALMLLGTDDGVKVWLDGEEVHRLLKARSAVKWDDQVPVKLKKGWNTVLIKVEEQIGGWCFYFDLVKPDHTALTDLKYSTEF